jgi:hypothetical protein
LVNCSRVHFGDSLTYLLTLFPVWWTVVVARSMARHEFLKDETDDNEDSVFNFRVQGFVLTLFSMYVNPVAYSLKPVA